jgi:hypothetical protein
MMSSKKIYLYRNLAAGGYQSLQTEDAVGHVGIFDSALWTVAPLTFSLVQLSPTLSPFPVSKYKYIQTVGGGKLSPVGDHILQEFYTLYRIWPDSKPTKFLDHPKQKPWRGGGGPQTDNHMPQSPFTDNFF